jgi:hypothetical protein
MLNSAVSSVQHQIAHIEEHVLPRMCYKLKNKSLYVFTNYLFYYLLSITKQKILNYFQITYLMHGIYFILYRMKNPLIQLSM